MKLRIFLPYAIIAAAICVFGVLACFGAPLPPLPPMPAKLQSPKASGSADSLNKSMLVVSAIIGPVTNKGAVSANFEATKIQGLQAGFVYRSNPTNGAWKILGTVPYPTNGGPVIINYLGTNIPALYFKAFYQFVAPPPNAY